MRAVPTIPVAPSTASVTAVVTAAATTRNTLRTKRPAKLPAKLRVLLADDHTIVRQGLKLIIDSQPDMEVVAEAADGRAAVQKATQFYPDIIVMDVSMPQVPGAAARNIKRELPTIGLIALSVHEEKHHVREMMAAGASGYVLKRSAAEDLIRAIRVVARGNVYIDPHFAMQVSRSMVNRLREPFHVNGMDDGDSRDGLTERETDVLRRIAQGYGNKEIALHLGLSVKTVETYKTRAVEKLGFSSRVDIVRYALEQGWLADTQNGAH